MINCPGCGHPRDWHARRINQCITYNGDQRVCPCRRSYADIQPTWWQRARSRLTRRSAA